MPNIFTETMDTARLRLRKPSLEDAEAIFTTYAQDREVTRYLIWKPHVSLADTRDFLAGVLDAWDAGERFDYVVEQKVSNTLLGMCSVRVNGCQVDFGYVLGRDYWGQSYIPEVINMLAEKALADPAINRVQATCDIENKNSARVLEKCGFIWKGRLENHIIHPNISPEPRASYLYEKAR
ncbi:GNAT family N-acetyltransferase [Cellvibrio japonicus]|uniref:Alanine acetyl transferase-like protein n=1 Tax=Cellvibrio japonicus (strain Ueda107) TaxID=498211 RepID=B3PJE9_CELJU|nr:GNAT family N-acetyltransferase [Cellvibrio japonicus]ACE82767.1 alanine acetyl transferase-like protein [Cellvibrio japonicus Ueda107]QEI12692.1 GNAT family N-acetyltransferase [Cellvibrio japonicus]QEI16266.1 GNAT family N-acetyltransferase [Cellvibrio japonicus]QEI19844.1 GNAT family N-acetyltransferase [Cellvibrio japonicus]